MSTKNAQKNLYQKFALKAIQILNEYSSRRHHRHENQSMNIALDIVTIYNYNNALSSIVRRDTNVSGVNPRRPVTHEELAQHNTRYVQVFNLGRHLFRESCWVAFNGMVYNCTPYMEYHPGGGDELMKSAGKLPN